MSNLDAVKKVMMYQKDTSGFVKEPTVKEMADLVVLVLSQVKLIEKAIKEGRLDGKTPVKDSDYLSKESALSLITKGINDALEKVESTLNTKTAQIDSEVVAALGRIRNGENGIVTEEEIQRAAEIALSMLTLPDFDELVTTQITSNSDAIRDALELLSGENRYRVEIQDVQGLESALEQLAQIRTANGGTIGKQQVYGFIRQAIADGTISGGTGVTDGDKGDITVSSSGATWTIDNDTIGQDELATTGTPDGTKFLRDDMQWTAIPGGGDALTANPLSQFAATTSLQLAGVISDETGSGALVFGTSPTLTTPRFADGGFVADASGNEMIAFNSNASAVNYLELENGATGNPPHLRSKGDDTNIDLHLVAKGTGEVSVCDPTDETKRLRFGVSNNGTGIITTLRSNSTGSSKTIDLPNTSGTIALTSDLHSAVTVTDSTSIDFTLTGQDITAQREALTGAITASKNSNTTSLGSFTKAQLDTAVSDGNVLYVGDITQYTDELAQDAVGGMAANSTFVSLTYNDATPSLTPSLSATGTPSSSTYLRGDNTWATVSGSGDVVGPASSVDNAIVRFDGTTGKLIQDYTSGAPTVSDTGAVNIPLTSGNSLVVDTSVLVADATNNRVGIGTAAPVVRLHSSDGVTPAANTYLGTEAFLGSASASSLNFRLFTTNATATSAANFVFLRARGTADTPTVVQSGDALGGVAFQGWDGTTRVVATQISSFVDGTPGTNDMPGRIVFSTTADGAAAVTDRIIIDSAGALKPATNDGSALGTTALGFSDVHLATGAVINWANGEVTITETDANTLTVAGATAVSLGTTAAFTTGTVELGAASDTTISRSSAGIIAVEGVTVPLNSTTNTHTAQQIELGHASDTTISRASAGVAAVEGNEIVVANRAAIRSMLLTAAGGQPTTTSGCAAMAKVEAGTNDIDYNVLDFDATTQEYAFWNARLPDNYDGGTVTARFIWTSSAGGAGGTVVWGIQALAIGNDDAIDAAYGTAVEVSDDWIANGDIHISAATSAITIAGTPQAGDMLMLRVYRDPADANDDLTGDARLMQVVLEYGINSYTE